MISSTQAPNKSKGSSPWFVRFKFKYLALQCSAAGPVLELQTIHRILTIREKAPYRAFSWLKAPISAFTLRNYYFSPPL